ncbi:MAG: SAM-dependent methyltransferase [Citromicrobium sp.]|nr:SAM-dependent methyltransferase [Citromicrobium sp.]
MTSLRQLSGVPASFRLAGLFLLRTENGSIRFNLPDGRSVLFDHGNPGPRAVVDVHEFGFAKRALAGGDIGFAESYMDGEWSTPDLTAVLEFFSENFEAAGKLAVGGSLVKGINKVRHFFNRNSKAGARRNIMAHYDLGNDFYESWLDETMTYSSALFDKPNMSLEQAQTAKYAGIADQLSAGPDSSLLEIGCGWGGFAEYAAKVRGSKVTCLTISEAQRNYAASRMQAEGLSDRVEIRLEDYRDHQGKYDGVASIEMFEAVGEAYWPSYFQKIHESLDGSAKAALQIITIDDDLFRRYRKRTDFIQRYIFPGGMLPSEKALRESLSAAGLRFDAVHYFGQDYAKTLKLWAERFEEAWDRIQTFGFDERFRRLWRFYLSYCEAGFGNGRINVGQFQLSRA